MKFKKFTLVMFIGLIAFSLASPAFAAKGGTPNATNGKGKTKTTLSNLVINGPSSLDENTSVSFAATATWSDGSSSAVTPTWVENSYYTTISTDGVLTASSVNTNQTVTVTASSSSGGVTKTVSKTVSIVDVPAAAPTLSSLAISGPTSVNESTSSTFAATATWSNGSTSTISPTWSENSSYATISTGGVLTASAVTASQTVTVTASFASGGITKTATKSVSIIDIAAAAPTLSSLAISGPASVNESTSATFAATATWSDGSTSAITPTWSENSAYATISTGGVLTASAVSTSQTVTVTASFASGGITKTATRSVSIVDTPTAVLPAQVTLAWDPSTDSQVIGYRLYYKESTTGDPSYNTPPFDNAGSPIDVGLNESYAMNLPYDTTVFCFSVTAYNADGLESTYSNIACTTN